MVQVFSKRSGGLGSIPRGRNALLPLLLSATYPALSFIGWLAGGELVPKEPEKCNDFELKEIVESDFYDNYPNHVSELVKRFEVYSKQIGHWNPEVN